MRAALLTISTSKANDGRGDGSGAALLAFAGRLGAEVIGVEIVPDDQRLIEARLRHWADEAGSELILTSGGTGFSPSDVTPEATRAAIEREAPGLAEAMRAASRPHTDHWMLSRGVAGIRGRTLIVNFPGSPASVEQAGAAIAGALPHALELIAGVAPARHG
jgi:molybdenum cofactor synthesis domain-containing protein